MKDIALTINYTIDYFFILLGVFALAHFIITRSEDNKRQKETEAKEKYRLTKQQEYFLEDIAHLSQESKDKLLSVFQRATQGKLSRMTEDPNSNVLLLMKFPEHYLDNENIAIINRILENYETNPKDKELFRWVDYWIFDYVKDVCTPVLSEKNYDN